MKMKGILERLFRRSLIFRLILFVTIAAAVGISILLLVALRQMDSQIEDQSALVRTIAQKQAKQRLDSYIKLINYRIEANFQQLKQQLITISSLHSTNIAIQSSNDVQIAAEIGQKIIKYGFTGGLIIDSSKRVVGASDVKTELILANSALKIHKIYGELDRIINESSPSRNETYRFTGIFDAAYAAILQAPIIQNRFGTLIASPVFNDFGESVGVILAYRIITQSEESLSDFEAITGTKIALMAEGKVFSTAGINPNDVNLQPSNIQGLQFIPEIAFHARCGDAFSAISICAIRPNIEIEHFSEELMSLGRIQTLQTQKILSLLGAIAIAAVFLLLFFAGKMITNPLADITQAIDKVANGEWRVEVKHIEEEDEIGKIARAIAAMQVSLVERDRMRHEMSRIDIINQRRIMLEGATERFEHGMIVVVKDLADKIRTLNDDNKTIEQGNNNSYEQVEAIQQTIEKINNSNIIIEQLSNDLIHLPQDDNEEKQIENINRIRKIIDDNSMIWAELTENVNKLRDNISICKNTSSNIIMNAKFILEEAKQIDGTVRKLIREVTL